MQTLHLEVSRSAIGDVRQIDDGDPPVPPEGSATLAVARFGLTTNNVTYAAMGDAMHYWDFFAATDPAWGVVPVWGFAEVVESRCDTVAAGDRLYGYLPMGTHAVVTPAPAGADAVTDVSDHRAHLAAAYNRYQRVEPGDDTGPRADLRMLLHPLFATAWLLGDAITGRDALAGAPDAQVVISSASSKTAIATAHTLASADVTVVGLTSAANVAFVQRLGVYDHVATYDTMDTVPVATSAFVDVAGNAGVRREVHEHLASSLVASLAVGITHRDAPPVPGTELPGAHPEFFFAPTHMADLASRWGAAEVNQRLNEAWDAFATWAGGWVQPQAVVGPGAVATAWTGLAGAQGQDPATGLVCSWT